MVIIEHVDIGTWTHDILFHQNGKITKLLSMATPMAKIVRKMPQLVILLKGMKCWLLKGRPNL